MKLTYEGVMQIISKIEEAAERAAIEINDNGYHVIAESFNDGVTTMKNTACSVLFKMLGEQMDEERRRVS